jgi:hypothetical protein
VQCIGAVPAGDAAVIRAALDDVEHCGSLSLSMF